jgi:uncharacterized protein
MQSRAQRQEGMMAKQPIPDAGLDDRLFFGGTAGSGKTYNAMGRVERLLAKGARVVIPDPLGVWWGLRLTADGKHPSGYDVAIFGGPHGDLPLTEHAGALIGETVAGMKESCILDLSQLGTKAAERRFMLAFLTALYKHTTGEPLHVVFDEADMWSPQRLLDKEGEAAKLLGMMETVVRRGRVKGFIPWLISQRPAVISKDVLSQVDGLIAFKLTSSQDRDAIGDWVEGQADKAQWREIWSSLPTMERGQGVVWIPVRGILETVQFPEKETFDSSRTPKRGEKAQRAAELKPLDLGALKERLATVEAETKANDPKSLRAEIATLKRGLAAKQAPPIDPAAIEQADQRGYVRGWRDGVSAAKASIDPHVTALAAAASSLRTLGPSMEVKPVAPRHVGNGHAHPPQAPRALRQLSGDSKLPRAERRILAALAQYRAGRAKNQVAVLTGYAVNGGGFNNALSALRTVGYLTGSGDRFEITDDGLAALGSYDPLPTGPDLLDHWMRQLPKAERESLRVLAGAYPSALTKEDVAAVAGYAPDGGGFNNALSKLRTLELISGRGELKASDDFFV